MDLVQRTEHFQIRVHLALEVQVLHFELTLVYFLHEVENLRVMDAELVACEEDVAVGDLGEFLGPGFGEHVVQTGSEHCVILAFVFERQDVLDAHERSPGSQLVGTIPDALVELVDLILEDHLLVTGRHGHEFLPDTSTLKTVFLSLVVVFPLQQVLS